MKNAAIVHNSVRFTASRDLAQSGHNHACSACVVPPPPRAVRSPRRS
jgi:hypothetical protein